MRTKILAGLVAALGLALLPAVPVSARDVTQSNLDRDGNGRADFALVRDQAGGIAWFWALLPGFQNDFFGDDEDFPQVGDFDGDGRNDPTVYRFGTPSTFHIQFTSGGFATRPFGQQGDTPLTADFNGDGRTDIAQWRPGTPAATLFVSFTGGGFHSFQFGADGDSPFVGDFNGDGLADVGVRRADSGNSVWHIRLAGGVFVSPITFGEVSDWHAPGDYSGDGRADIVVTRVLPNDNVRWFGLSIRPSGVSGPAEILGYSQFDFGQDGDVDTQADYDGDGRTDISVWRGENPGRLFIHNSSNGVVVEQTFGQSTDTPVVGWANCFQNIRICG